MYYNQYYQGTELGLQINLLEKLGPINGKILEVGSGKGELLNFFKEQNISYAGVEILDSLCEKLNDDGHEVYKSIYEVPLEDFNYIFMCSVIEHMKFEEVEYILNNFKGTILIETPDIRIDYALLRIPFKNKLSFWDDYQHIKPYTPTSLKRLMVDYGFEVIGDGRVKIPLANKIKYIILESIAKLNEIISGIQHPYYMVARKVN